MLVFKTADLKNILGFSFVMHSNLSTVILLTHFNEILLL